VLWILLEDSTELYGNIPIQLLPAMPLMRGPDCQIDAASSTEWIPWRVGSILYIYGIESVEDSNGIPQSCMEEFYSNTTGLEGSICHLNRCC